MRNWHNEIEDDLKWRENELLCIKKIAFDLRENDGKHVTVLRALWIMLYAHFEGYCKFLWDIYLDYIESCRVQNKDLLKSIMIISLSKKLDNHRKGMNNESLCDFYDIQYPEYLADIAKFSDDNKLDTNSNLYPNVLDTNNKIISISLTEIHVKNNRRNIKALVSRRNDIAHGKKMYITNLSEYQEYENSVFDVMIDFACKIIDAIDSDAHLRKQHDVL